VLALVEWARRLDDNGLLHREFEAPRGLEAEKLEKCLIEEGGIRTVGAG
jgi:hypothetical protein